jgi:hypothetical protein
MLIEAAWSYWFPAWISRELLLRQEGLAKPIRDIAWKAQERLTCRELSTRQYDCRLVLVRSYRPNAKNRVDIGSTIAACDR